MVIYNVQSNGSCNQLVIELINDTIYVDSNMVAYVTGNINLESKNEAANSLKALWINKDCYKPKFQGTGKIFIRATLGSFYKFALKEGEELIINPCAFVACRESISVIPKINFSLRRFLTGIPMVDLSVKGNGNVMAVMSGPVQEIQLKNEKFLALGAEIAAYSPQLTVTREIVGKNWLSGPKMARIFRGTGSVFFAPIPNKDAASRISK